MGEKNLTSNYKSSVSKISKIFSALFTTKSLSPKQIVTISFVCLLAGTVFLLEPALAAIISVGQGPIGIELVESQNLLFVANQISNTVSIIDISTDTVINTVSVGLQPIKPIYVPSTALLYVTNSASNEVSVIDVSTPASASVVTTIPVGTFPYYLEYNSVNKKVYAVNCFTNNVSVIDANSASVNFNTVIDTIGVGTCPTSIRFNDATNKIYVGNTFGNTVSVIDANTDTVVSTINITGAGEIEVDKVNNRIYVSNALSNTISVLDGTTDAILQTVPVGNNPRDIVFNPTSDQILVANNLDGTVSIIDSNTLTTLGAVPVGSSPFGMKITSSNVIYAANQDTASVTTVDIGSNIPPTANAGPDQIVNEGDVVQLDGTGSSDFDGDPLTYQWNQTKGPQVILSSSSDSSPTFTAPEVDNNTLLEFKLIVNDGTFDSLADFVNIIIKDLTVFEVPLNFVGSQLEGDIAFDSFPADNQITLDFINPDVVLEGKLEDAKITSKVSGSNVEFDFIASTEEPDTVPPLQNPALYYEIENTVIDFSDTGNLPADNLPTSQFLISKDYDTGDNFTDGCPVVFNLFLNENTNSWEIHGDPLLSNTNKIYVVDPPGNQIFAIDGNTNEITDSIQVGTNPRSGTLEPTMNKLYVNNVDSGTVSVIDTLTNTVQKTILVPGAADSVLDSNTSKLYVATLGPGVVSVIDVNSDTVVDTIPTSSAGLNKILFNPDLHRLYVTGSASNSLSVIDANTNTEIDKIALGGIPVGGAINPDNNTVYIGLFTINTVVAIDGVTNTIIENIPVGFAPIGVDINPLTDKVFVANAGDGTVSVIDTNINVVIKKIQLDDSIYGLAVNKNTDRVFVVNSDTGDLSIIDGSKGQLLENLPINPGLFNLVLNDAIPNPVRDPASDVLDAGTNEILECGYIAKLPHLSKFAVGGVVGLTANFLGGAGGGTGAPTSSLGVLSSNTNYYIPTEIEQIIENFDPTVPLSPMDPNLYEDFDFPFTINYTSYNGYPLVGFENTIEPNIVKVGTPVTLEFIFFEDTDIQHFSLYSGLYGSKTNPSESNIQILYNKDKPLEVIDPFESLTDVNVTKTKLDENKIKVTVSFTPIKENSLKDLIVRTWDPNLSSWDLIIRDVFDVVPDLASEPSTSTFSEPIIVELKSTTIPLWIKSNAAWWSDQQISDDDFVAGLEYLIKNNIINVPGVEVSSTSTTQIPDWIQSNAGWWADSLISDGDFIEAMQWLIANGVIQI